MTSVVAVFPKELRSSIWWGATEGGEELSGGAHRAEAKISHLDGVTGGVEDILGLQVSMDDVVVMLKSTKRWKISAGSLSWYLTIKDEDTICYPNGNNMSQVER